MLNISANERLRLVEQSEDHLAKIVRLETGAVSHWDRETPGGHLVDTTENRLRSYRFKFVQFVSKLQS